MAYIPPTFANYTPGHSHVIMDIFQPMQRLAADFKEAEDERRVFAKRRERKGGDEFQLGLEEQWQWWQDKLHARSEALGVLRDALTPDLFNFMTYLED